MMISSIFEFVQFITSEQNGETICETDILGNGISEIFILKAEGDPRKICVVVSRDN